jgi:hypothetical protein
MRILQRVTAGVALLSLSTGAMARAQCPGMENFKPPTPGSWAEYKTDEGTMRMALLGTEARNGQNYMRMEMAMTSNRGPMIMQMLVPGWPYEVGGIAEMVMQQGGQPAMRMPQQMLSMMASRMPKDAVAEACRNATGQRVGEETITVPAGTFSTIHFRDAQHNTDVWVNPQLPFGMVQVKSEHGSMVLTGRGTDAKSQITGPMQDMPMR